MKEMKSENCFTMRRPIYIALMGYIIMSKWKRKKDGIPFERQKQGKTQSKAGKESKRKKKKRVRRENHDQKSSKQTSLQQKALFTLAKSLFHTDIKGTVYPSVSTHSSILIHPSASIHP